MLPQRLGQRRLGQASGSRGQGFRRRRGQLDVSDGRMVHPDQYPGHTMVVAERTAYTVDGLRTIQIQQANPDTCPRHYASRPADDNLRCAF